MVNLIEKLHEAYALVASNTTSMAFVYPDCDSKLIIKTLEELNNWTDGDEEYEMTVASVGFDEGDDINIILYAIPFRNKATGSRFWWGPPETETTYGFWQLKLQQLGYLKGILSTMVDKYLVGGSQHYKNIVFDFEDDYLQLERRPN